MDGPRLTILKQVEELCQILRKKDYSKYIQQYDWPLRRLMGPLALEWFQQEEGKKGETSATTSTPSSSKESPPPISTHVKISLPVRQSREIIHTLKNIREDLSTEHKTLYNPLLTQWMESLAVSVFMDQEISPSSSSTEHSLRVNTSNLASESAQPPERQRVVTPPASPPSSQEFQFPEGFIFNNVRGWNEWLENKKEMDARKNQTSSLPRTTSTPKTPARPKRGRDSQEDWVPSEDKSDSDDEEMELSQESEPLDPKRKEPKRKRPSKEVEDLEEEKKDEESEEEEEEEMEGFTDNSDGFPGYPVDWFSGEDDVHQHYMPRKDCFQQYHGAFKSLAEFGRGAMSHTGMATRRTRELVGRLSANLIQLKLEPAGRHRHGECILCGSKNRPLQAAVKFLPMDGPRHGKMKWGKEEETNGQAWRFVDILPTSQYKTYFAMYAYWPQAWNLYHKYTDANSKWISVGRCCASRLALLALMLHRMAHFRRLDDPTTLFTMDQTFDRLLKTHCVLYEDSYSSGGRPSVDKREQLSARWDDYFHQLEAYMVLFQEKEKRACAKDESTDYDAFFIPRPKLMLNPAETSSSSASFPASQLGQSSPSNPSSWQKEPLSPIFDYGSQDSQGTIDLTKM